MLITLVVFIIILGLLIFVHEFGHFITAKQAGIRVDEFAFGFPPRLFSIKKGETTYSLNLIPFGGYVKMLGEEEDASQAEKINPRSFAHQSWLVRGRVVAAGVFMNMALAWLLISFGLMIGIPPLVSQPTSIPNATVTELVTITGIAANSTAATMGLKLGDKVVLLNDQAITTSEQLAGLTRKYKGQPVSMVVSRANREVALTGTLSDSEPPLGARLNNESTVRLPVWWAPVYGIWETLKAAGLIFVGIIQFFKELFTTAQVPEGAAGPIGIFYHTRNVLQLGFAAMLNFVAILSINLAVINILPIPALDGGRLLFILLEKFNRGKKVVNQHIENIAHLIGFVLLIALILAISYQDILKLGS